ncbi:MAG TPA: NUDIX hydrolase [Solirubrobacterales bacterium]|nr:NUDIX hydrolase [Solirubrobacterales bacterium]
MELLHSETVFDGPFVDLARKRYRRADGSEVERQVVEHPGSVGIVAHDEERVYLVRQPREAVEEDGLVEIPAGTLDKADESEQQCAERELAEEVGLRAGSWSELHTIYASPGFLSERLTIFEATGLAPAAGETDETEQIEIVRLPLAELDAAIAELEDAKTLIGLLLLRERLRPARQPGKTRG